MLLPVMLAGADNLAVLIDSVRAFQSPVRIFADKRGEIRKLTVLPKKGGFVSRHVGRRIMADHLALSAEAGNFPLA